MHLCVQNNTQKSSVLWCCTFFYHTAWNADAV